MPKVEAWNCLHRYSDGSISTLRIIPREGGGKDDTCIDIERVGSEFVAVNGPEQFADFIQAMMAAAKQIGWLKNSKLEDSPNE